MMLELFLILSVVWTAPDQPPAPFPECVEIVDNDTVILHIVGSGLRCNEGSAIENLDYYQVFGYAETFSNYTMETGGIVILETVK